MSVMPQRVAHVQEDEMTDSEHLCKTNSEQQPKRRFIMLAALFSCLLPLCFAIVFNGHGDAIWGGLEALERDSNTGSRLNKEPQTSPNH